MGDLFTTFGLDVKLLLIQVVNFGLLLLILWKFLYTPVLRMIDQRRGTIADAVKKAEAADQRLADADTEGKSIVASAGREAEGLVASGRSKASQEGAEILKRTQEKADQLLQEATMRGEEAKRQALAAGQKEIARAAMLAAEKILREKHS